MGKLLTIIINGLMSEVLFYILDFGILVLMWDLIVIYYKWFGFLNFICGYKNY